MMLSFKWSTCEKNNHQLSVANGTKFIQEYLNRQNVRALTESKLFVTVLLFLLRYLPDSVDCDNELK